MRIKYVIYFILVLLIINCKGQSQKENECNNNYNQAQKLVNEFVLIRDTISLQKALNLYSKSMNCSQMRKKSIEKKLLYINLIEDFEQGLSFVDSLSVSDFDKEYKKKMYLDFYNAKMFEKKGEIVERDRYYTLIIDNIMVYLDGFTKDMIDKEAYYDLYFIKSQYLSEKTILEEIENLERSYPKYHLYFNSLKNMFTNVDDKISEPEFD